jgi:copper chaperone CopZ
VPVRFSSLVVLGIVSSTEKSLSVHAVCGTTLVRCRRLSLTLASEERIRHARRRELLDERSLARAIARSLVRRRARTRSSRLEEEERETGRTDWTDDADFSVLRDAHRSSTTRLAQSNARRTLVSRATAGSNDEAVVLTLKVEGMMCEGCAESVTTQLMNNTKGVNVTAVDVNLDTKLVKVSVDCESVVEGLATIPALVETVQEGGFEAEPEFD